MELLPVVAKKRKLTKRTLKEWLLVYGMRLIPLIQFAIFYI